MLIRKSVTEASSTTSSGRGSGGGGLGRKLARVVEVRPNVCVCCLSRSDAFVAE